MAHQRQDISFQSQGLTCRGWLYKPDGADKPPVVVMAHGFSAERTFRLPAFAEVFADAGMAVLLFDYRNFGDSEGEPRFLVDPRRHLEDWRAAVACARGRDDLDASRIALWGSSFSGGHVIMTAAEDQKIAAIVAQVPYVGGIEVKLSAADTLKAAMAIIGDRIASLWGGSVTVPIVGPPGSFAAMNAPEAMEFLEIVPPESKWNNRVPARALTTLASYQPRDVAARVSCPALVLVGSKDETTPPDFAEGAAALMPKGEVASYDAGHFEVYVPPMFEQVVAREKEFLARHLGV